MPLKVTKLGDLINPIRAMAQDVIDAEEILKVREDCHSRRSYVRALFAFVEGSVYFIKQTAFTAAIRSQIPLSLGFHALLREETYSLDDKGGIIIQTDRFPPAANNLRFAVKCVNEIFGSSISIDSSRHWGDFKMAIKIRNRITHPKDLVEFEVSADETTLCQRVFNDWFFGLVSDLVTAINDKVTGRQHNHQNRSLSDDEILYVAHKPAPPSITRGRDCNLGEQGLDTCDPGGDLGDVTESHAGLLPVAARLTFERGDHAG